MGKRFSILIGILLVLMGGLIMAFNLVAPALQLDVWRWGTWRLWPLIVVFSGLLFVVPPFLVRGKRGLGGLFIAGVPILATGGILCYTSLLHRWGAWAWLWPVEVIALAMGFLLAAIYMRLIWLLLPAIVLGTNGAIFQFCALTGLWELWAVVWAFEPLSIGLAFLIINLKQRSTGVLLAGLVLCVVGALGLMGMSALFPEWLLLNLLGPAALLLAGLVLLIWGVTRRSSSSGPGQGPEPEPNSGPEPAPEPAVG